MLPPVDDSELPIGQAESLAHHKGDLSLNNYTVISSEGASLLGQHKGGTLWLNGLRSLSAEAAASLAAHEGSMSLDGLTVLSDEAAAALSR